ncbi:MAG: hypothetical protein HS116_25400 [Planctomycetes bacterium]|nr:hypothetical protein [Planctomycetota bacterium]
MAMVEELFQGRTETVSDRPSAEIPFVVREAADEAEVKAAALADTPLLYAGLPRKSIEIAERINAVTWKIVVRYEKAEHAEQENPEPVFSFDTSGGTQHITQSLQTRARYGPQASELLGGAIGFDGEQVAGVDIAVPVYNFAETRFFSPGAVDNAFLGVIFRATGSVNFDAFRGFLAGEVLFLGASGSRRGTDPDDLWEITYKFAASPNRENLQVGSIAGIAKKGWDYLWVQYAADVDDGVQALIKKPVAVYVERVYPETEFALLGLG